MEEWLDILGLFLVLIGIIIFANGLIIPRKRAIKVSVSRISEETDEENIKLPSVRDRLRESLYAFFGLIFLIVGFLLQIVACILRI